MDKNCRLLKIYDTWFWVFKGLFMYLMYEEKIT